MFYFINSFIHFPCVYVSLARSLTGDDRNIVEVFVAGRKVVPFTIGL